MSGVYAAWKQRLGSKCWTLLEDALKFPYGRAGPSGPADGAA